MIPPYIILIAHLSHFFFFFLLSSSLLSFRLLSFITPILGRFKNRKNTNCRKKEYADGLSIPFLETSAKTGHEVENAFHKLTEEILKQQAGGWNAPRNDTILRHKGNGDKKSRC